MASPSAISISSLSDWNNWITVPTPAAQTLPYIVTAFFLGVLVLTLSSSQDRSHLKHVPLVNPTQTRRAFVNSSKQMMALGRKLYPEKPFRILTDWGEVLMLPPEFAHEIRNEPKLSFGLAVQQDNHGNIPGFETVKFVGRTDQLLQAVARKQLTKHLSAVIEPLSKETTLALSVNFGESPDWHEIKLKPAVLDIIARLSSRIYLGEQLCQNEAWLSITKNYTTLFFTASNRLRLVPRPFRPLAHWFLPECQELRAEFYKARKIIGPLIQRRCELRKAAVKAGKPVPEFNDALDWAETEAKGKPYDPAVFQLTLSLLAIHTTFDLLEQCMLDLARNPQFVEPLRDEIMRVLRTEGWKKNALYNMKLLDSAIKESQRLKPGSLATMRRLVTGEVKLSNGLVLKRGTRLNVDGYRMQDPHLHDNPDKYDAYRFFNMRSQPGKENMAQLVSTNVDHLGFGHGEHSCPGRFFAANEIKAALCHILVKYEWKLTEGSQTTPDVKGMVAKSSPVARILIRRRENVELDIDNL